MSEMSDLIAPYYVGEDKISLELDASTPPLALQPITINFNYDAADPEGIVLPLEVIVQPPSKDGSGYVRRIFRRVIPPSFTFIPIDAGEHLILMREVGHNRWQGRLLLTILGDEMSKIEIERS